MTDPGEARNPKAHVHATSPRRQEVRRARHAAEYRREKREDSIERRKRSELHLLRNVAEAARYALLDPTPTNLRELRLRVDEWRAWSGEFVVETEGGAS